MSYHITEISPGVYGEISKIQEELNELIDAKLQGSDVMELVELSDLIGAIEAYAQKKHGKTLEDLIIFSNITKRAFISGSRTPKSIDTQPKSE